MKRQEDTLLWQELAFILLRGMAAERDSIAADHLRNQEDPSPFVSDSDLIESKIQFLQLRSWT